MTAAKPDMPETRPTRLSVEKFRFISGTAIPIGPRQLPPAYDQNPRFAGTTGYSLGKMLRLASYLGLAMGCGSIAMIAYTLMSWSMHSAVTGWTSLTAIVLAMGGTQFLDLRYLGEYLDRLDIESEGQPLSVTDATIRGSTQALYEEADASRRMAA